jgi:hypothetical protein
MAVVAVRARPPLRKNSSSRKQPIDDSVSKLILQANVACDI